MCAHTRGRRSPLSTAIGSEIQAILAMTTDTNQLVVNAGP
jgi:hypothetical protein